MVRMSVRTFLVKAKQNLQQTLKNNGEASFVIGNESADLDSITSAIVYGYIQTSTLESMRAQKFYIPVTNIPASDLSLRPELTALLKHAAISPSDLITLDDLESIPLNLSKSSWTLVDHNALQGALGQHYRASVTGCIDHHDDEHHVPSTAEPRLITKSGSCSSLVANHCRDVWDVVASSSPTPSKLSTNVLVADPPPPDPQKSSPSQTAKVQFLVASRGTPTHSVRKAWHSLEETATEPTRYWQRRPW
ncbi:hypothetical protein KC334_g368 [Hortaea werneckii]|nr:hypothetical protein KC334_g368 [Hortaea werneckii]